MLYLITITTGLWDIVLIFVIVSQMRKLRLWVVKGPTQSHWGTKWQSCKFYMIPMPLCFNHRTMQQKETISLKSEMQGCTLKMQCFLTPMCLSRWFLVISFNPSSAPAKMVAYSAPSRPLFFDLAICSTWNCLLLWHFCSIST